MRSTHEATRAEPTCEMLFGRVWATTVTMGFALRTAAERRCVPLASAAAGSWRNAAAGVGSVANTKTSSKAANKRELERMLVCRAESARIFLRAFKSILTKCLPHGRGARDDPRLLVGTRPALDLT